MDKRWTKGMWLAAALTTAACHGAASHDVELKASPLAQAFGVGSYEMVNGDVAVKSLKGDALAVLKVTHPSDVKRLVTIRYAEGAEYTDEVGRPLDGKFDAPVNNNREGAIQADPALAAFFAPHAMSFHVIPDVPAAERIATQTTASCDQIFPFSGACMDCGCNGSWSYGDYTYAQRTGICPPQNCPSGPGQIYDEVVALETCPSSGACSFQRYWDGACDDPTCRQCAQITNWGCEY